PLQTPCFFALFPSPPFKRPALHPVKVSLSGSPLSILKRSMATADLVSDAVLAGCFASPTFHKWRRSSGNHKSTGVDSVAYSAPHGRSGREHTLSSLDHGASTLRVRA